MNKQDLWMQVFMAALPALIQKQTHWDPRVLALKAKELADEACKLIVKDVQDS